MVCYSNDFLNDIDCRFPEATYISSRDAWDKLKQVKGWEKVSLIFCFKSHHEAFGSCFDYNVAYTF